MDYLVLVPHLGDKPEPYKRGDTRTIDNEQWARELLANGVVAEPDKPKPEPEPAPKPKPKSKK
ncbi:MAG TPA: hypothetical protein PLZ58_04510 [Candidatus Saccharibacteria bacterium]|nr:hypothetical protein [Candidatus Saccharibacteria bacterium]